MIRSMEKNHQCRTIIPIPVLGFPMGPPQYTRERWARRISVVFVAA